MTATFSVLLDGLVFSEDPRWHDGMLFFSDMHARQVHRVRVDGTTLVEDSIVVTFDDDTPSGLGWLPDGSLIVVMMESQRVVRVDESGSVSEHADCSHLARGSLNDMISRTDGTAYVGDMGSQIFSDHPDHSTPGQTFRISPNADVAVAADNLRAPNGHILTPDERTLIVAESGGSRLTAFTVESDGTLTEQRVFAELAPAEGRPVAAPDGICLDAQGAVWVADPVGHRLLRVHEGGKVSQDIPIDGVPVAVLLGGADRSTLYACVADDWKRETVVRLRNGRILAMPVEVAGAGKP